MKRLLERTLQTIFAADAAMHANSGAVCPTAARWGVTAVRVTRRLGTRLGPVHLLLPVEAAGAPRVFDRYSENEMTVLLLLGRVVARGRASVGAVRDLAELLCGRRFDAAVVGAVAGEINEELRAYLQRELERGYFDDRRYALFETKLTPASPVPAMNAA